MCRRANSRRRIMANKAVTRPSWCFDEFNIRCSNLKFVVPMPFHSVHLLSHLHRNSGFSLAKPQYDSSNYVLNCIIISRPPTSDNRVNWPCCTRGALFNVYQSFVWFMCSCVGQLFYGSDSVVNKKTVDIGLTQQRHTTRFNCTLDNHIIDGTYYTIATALKRYKH